LVLRRFERVEQKDQAKPISNPENPGLAPEAGRFPMGNFLGFEHGILAH
jgi:hypothetical protein